MSLTLEEKELLERIKWLIKLRWLVSIGVISITFFSNKVFKIDYPTLSIYLVAVFIFLYNLAFLFYEKLFIPKIIDSARIDLVTIFANIQIIVDLFVIALLIHLSGGVENPFMFYFIFHMIISSILFSTKLSFYQATLSCFLFVSVCFLEYFEIIPHTHLKGFADGKSYKNINYVAGVLFVFISTMYISVYITTSISRRLRKRHQEIVSLKEELERKNKTLVEMQEMLIHREKMSSMGQLSASIAHEVNNPLGGILIFASMLLEDETNPEKRESLKRIVDETIRCKDILRGLLDFSRKEEIKMELIYPFYPLENALSLVENMALFHNIDVYKEININTPKIKGNEKELQQAFLNIIINAAESMQNGGGKLYLRTYRSEDKKFAIVEIEDTGHGIKKEHLNKIFEPFFSTKEAGKGTGLGLSITYGIIQRHNGEIEVDSKIGVGAKFKIKFPINGS